MNTNIRSLKALLLCLVAAIFIVPATMAYTYPEPQAAAGPSGKLRVVGQVTVNGTSAISGATVFSDSTVTTAQNSSAVVSLGKLGRVEALPETRMKLRYDDSSISILIDAGSVRVQTGPGVAATITRTDR